MVTHATVKTQPKSLPMNKKIFYALGQLGWSLVLGLVTTYLIWYFLPPEGEAGAVNQTFIPQTALFLGLTVIGIINMLGRLVDAVTDPLIATLSDRSKHPRGRRISFMMKGGLPFAIFAILVFYSPVQGESLINSLFLGAMLILMYIAYTVYVTPYFALVSEFGHTINEKLQLSTFISATWFIGLGLATTIPPILWGQFEASGYDRVTAIRLAIGIMVIIGLILMYIPVFTIHEKDYAVSHPSDAGVLASMKATFSNKYFRIFVISDLAYWVGLTVFSSTMLYYVTVLLDLSEVWNGTVVTFTGILSFFCYPFVNIIAKKAGKKKLMIVAYVFYIAVYIFGTFMGSALPFSSEMQAYMIVLLAGFPMAVFGILPNAIVADLAELDARKTGVNREAMFFGARTFMSKLGQTLGALFVSSFLILGKSAENDIGIRMTTVFAAVVFAVSLILFLFYREKEVIDYLKTKA